MAKAKTYLLLIAWILSFELTAKSEVEFELDLYYTNIGLFVPLGDENIEEIEFRNEKSIYLQLFKDALTPRFFLVEASINPLPILGVYMKKHQSDFYDEASVSDDFNLIEALTEGFEEPYALSFFLGNIIRFKLKNETEQKAVNKGFSGFLLSVGDRHIKSNTLIDDVWYELEWKVKGDRQIGDIYHSWSFRVGTKIHRNPDIADVNYIGLRREFFNSAARQYKFLENTGIDYQVSFSRGSLNVVQHLFYVEKRWPGDKGEFTLGLGVNKIDNKYSGELADEDNDLRLIIRPGYNF